MIPTESTLEKLIEGLDQRGLLIFQIMLGKQAMSLLENEKKEPPVKPYSKVIPSATSIYA